MSDTFILGIRAQNSNLSVPSFHQVADHPKTLLLIIHRQIRIAVVVRINVFRRASGRTQDKGHLQLFQFFLRMVKVSAKKNNAPDTLFLYQFQRHFHLVLILIDMV